MYTVCASDTGTRRGGRLRHDGGPSDGAASEEDSGGKQLAGKIVIDTNNYYPQRDGHIPELDNESTTTAELLQAHLPTSKVVKAFNHIYAAQLTTDGQPAGSRNRRALVIAGDDAAAKVVVTNLLDDFGFDAVDAGPLKEGWRIQRDTPGYGPRRTAEELRKDLAAAKRYAEQ
jgi:8-hydroxy-5-deazaflavin:NADPH oxidoreductase